MTQTQTHKLLAFCGALALGATAAFGQQADNKALIDLLIQKGVLTTSEAQQVQAEAAKAVKAASANASSTTVSGKMYIDISNIQAETASGVKLDPSGTGIDVKRFYFGVTHVFNSVWSANINTDSAFSSSTGNTQLFIKTAFVQAKLDPMAVIQVGSANEPWIPFVEDLYGFRYVENTLVDRLKFGNSADWGVHLSGSNGVVSYSIAAVNGGGYKNPTRSKGMDLEGRLSVEPVKGLTFAVGGYTGKLGKDGNATPATHTASRSDFLAQYANAQFSLGGEYYQETDWGFTASGSSDKSDGYAVWGKVKLGGPVSLFARMDQDKPAKTLHPLEKDNYFNVGLQYNFMKGVDVSLVYKDDKIDNPISATQQATYHEIGLFSQIAF